MKKQFITPVFEVADFESLETLTLSTPFEGLWEQSEIIADDDVRSFSEIERLFK